ncbi:MAG: hypothetical protein ACYC60_22185 [Thermoanaerobaculia bacterium]
MQRRENLISKANDNAYHTDRDWSEVDGELCRVSSFTPMASMRSGKVVALPGLPYASVTLEREETGKTVEGFITHKTDFQMLWAAFRSRSTVPAVRLEFWSKDVATGQLADNEEVQLVWTRRKYRALPSLFARFLPRLVVMVSRKGAFDLIRDRTLKPELQGEARFHAEAPLVTWTPEVMKE